MAEEPFASGVLDGEFELLRGSFGVQALTDDDQEDSLAGERRVATRLAAALDTTLFLIDRSVRTWGDTPHVRGPATVEELREHGIDHMVRQMEEATELGAPNVLGLAPSIPTFDFLTDGLQATGAQVVVAPVKLKHMRLLDRLQMHGDLVPQVRERIGDRHLVVVEADGTVRLG